MLKFCLKVTIMKGLVVLNIMTKQEQQCENKLTSHERAFKVLKNDMCIIVIGQAILELFRSGNHQMGISLLQKFSEIFNNMRLISPKMTSYLTSHNFQV